MAETIKWIGGAAAVAQVDDFTPSDPAENDTITLTVTGENEDTVALVYTATATHTVAASIAGMVALWNASTHYLCTPVTASDAGTTIKLTADTAGVPFYVAPTCSAGTFTRAATTANSGPYDYKTAQNWDLARAPGSVATQSIIIEDATILYGLNQTACAESPYYIEINNSQVSQNPSTGRNPAYLFWDDAAQIYINNYYGPGSPTYSSPMFIKTTQAGATINVFSSGTNSDTDLPAIWLYTTAADAIVNVFGGKVGIGYEAKYGSTASKLATLSVGSGAYAYIGTCDTTTIINNGGTIVRNNRGAYITTYRQNSGTLTGYGAVTTAHIDGGIYSCYADITTINVNGGSVTIKAGGAYTGAVTTLNQTGGTVYYNDGVLTAANVTGGLLDTTQSGSTKTITTLKVDPPGSFKYNPAQTTLTNKVQPVSSNKTVTYSAS
jgi:hypothetical protein